MSSFYNWVRECIEAKQTAEALAHPVEPVPEIRPTAPAELPPEPAWMQGWEQWLRAYNTRQRANWAED